MTHITVQFNAVDYLTASLDLDDLDGIVDASRARPVIYAEGGIQSADREGVLDTWTGMSRGYELAYLGLTHTFRLFGEIDVIGGHWGYRTRF